MLGKKTSKWDTIEWVKKLHSTGFGGIKFCYMDIPYKLKNKSFYQKATKEGLLIKTNLGRSYQTGTVTKYHTGLARQYEINPGVLEVTNANQKIR